MLCAAPDAEFGQLVVREAVYPQRDTAHAKFTSQQARLDAAVWRSASLAQRVHSLHAWQRAGHETPPQLARCCTHGRTHMRIRLKNLLAEQVARASVCAGGYGQVCRQ